jgi:hypothetical protein
LGLGVGNERTGWAEWGMSDWLMKSIRQEAEQLIALAAEDEALRADLRELANVILTATARPGTSCSNASSSPGSPALVTDAAPTAEVTTSAEPLRELTLGRGSFSKSRPQPPATSDPRLRVAEADLSDLLARCRRKAEAAWWATECVRTLRRENRFEGENPPADRKIQKWANQLADRLLWLSTSGSLGPEDVTPLANVAGCFESVAAALVMAREQFDDPKADAKDLERLLTQVAEAQSALRVALLKLSAGGDPDQLDLFEWLKETAAREQVFIKRFMRADDHADPALWRELLARIESEPEGEPVERTSILLEQLRGQICRARATPDAGLDWTGIITTVAEIVASGAPPSNREIRDLLLPLLEELPDRDDLPGEFQAVLREIDRYLASRSAVPGAHGPSSSHWSPEVKEAAGLLEGRAVALIGGDRRREAEDSLRTALKLRDLFWIETREHQSIESFEAVVARPEVALVLLAIRWSSHSFGEVKQFCERHDKPLVRLPGGYNPNQVAVQILAQCSALLETRAPD